MSETQDNFAVMFADVAGSTRLYDTIGDVKAKATIEQVLNMMSKITQNCSGTVIKTIGDEIMCRFPSADDSINAACGIQEELEEQPPINGVKVAVRIGIHFGPAIMQADGDVFGDAVNVAARMAGIAKGRQIITTGETSSRLRPELAEKSRLFDRTTVKGKAEEIIVHEIVWEQEDDVTRIMTPVSDELIKGSSEQTLKVEYKGREVTIPTSGAGFSIGRGPANDLVVGAPLASRAHARIEFRRGKYILMDQSTNGTYVRTQDGKEVYLRREELPLWGEGFISLGQEIDPSNPDIMTFKA